MRLELLRSFFGTAERCSAKRVRSVTRLTALAVILLPLLVHTAHADDSAHGGLITPVLAALFILLLAGKIGGDLVLRAGQPAVLGELLIGLVLGNLGLLGITYFDGLKHDSIVTVLAELGVILLLFEVGLETSVPEMLKVGWSSLLVAILGVVAPFLLGWLVAAYFLPEANILVHIFVGATLTATSVGITARVLKDLGKTKTKEAKIILGAAVIDDVLGLLVLAVVTSTVHSANAGTKLDTFGILKIVFLALGFLALAIGVGRALTPRYFKLATYLKSHGVLLASTLSLCFGLSYLAGLCGLAPIVGAFTAGLILEPVQYKDLALKEGKATVDELIHPITQIFAPIFFILMGARVELWAFADTSVLGFAAVLTLAAIIGKQLCSLGVREPGVDRVVVGLSMIPRGEVGLIFAGIGLTLMLDGERVIDSATFGAVVIMVIVTTMVTPPLIKWRFGKS